jgi:hypothetical protein
VIDAAFARTNDYRLFAVVVSLEDRKETSAIAAIGAYGAFDHSRSRDRARFVRLAYAPIARTDDNRFVEFAVLNEACKESSAIAAIDGHRGFAHSVASF